MTYPDPEAVPRHSMVKLALKALAALAAAAFLVILLAASLQFVLEESGAVSRTDLINWCEGDYYDRDYASLYETLTLYDLYGEEFALYWEAVDGYQAYIRCRQWAQAASRGIPGAAEKATQALTELEALAASPDFPQNAGLLAELCQQAPGIA